MAYQLFNVPAVLGGGDDAAELNAFLRGHKIVTVHREFVQDGAASRHGDPVGGTDEQT